MTPDDAQARLDACKDCSGCDAYRAGEIRHGEPCAACPLGVWDALWNCRQMEPVSAPLPEPSLPSNRAMAGNVVRSVLANGAAILRGDAPVTAEEAARRLEICQGCEAFRASDERCARCGCYLRHKTAWRAEACPAGKW